MRRIRPIPPCPPEVLPSGSPGADERERAIAHFSAADWPTKEANKATSFSFTAYGKKPVKRALEQAFGGLCAYCETPYTAGTGGDIEHYRPKAAVDTRTMRKRKPGYYWLAATWENLLPSCKRCNSEERYTYSDGRERKSGKGNAFPLEAEDARASAPGEEAGEQPLLLHPYRDDPEDHLEFVEEGFLRPRDGSLRGEKTIDVLGLNRPGLLDRRRARLVIVEAALKRLEEAEKRIEQYPNDPSFGENREREIADLEHMLKQGQEYSALVAQRTRVARP